MVGEPSTVYGGSWFLLAEERVRINWNLNEDNWKSVGAAAGDVANWSDSVRAITSNKRQQTLVMKRREKFRSWENIMACKIGVGGLQILIGLIVKINTPIVYRVMLVAKARRAGMIYHDSGAIVKQRTGHLTEPARWYITNPHDAIKVGIRLKSHRKCSRAAEFKKEAKNIKSTFLIYFFSINKNMVSKFFQPKNAHE